MRRAQHEAVGDVEEVVAGDAQVHGLRVLGPAAVLDHALVVGVDLELGLVGRLGPAVHGGLDALHGQVGALHDAHLDRRAAAGPALARPRGEGALHAVRVGQVGLEHDARAQGQELRLVQHLAERRHREVEVAVLLHVEVDELRRDPPVRMAVPMPRRRPVERAQPLGHARHRGAKGDEVDLAEDRRDLHRDVLDVVAGEQGEVRVQAARRLRLAEDRLAELVEVQPDARAAALVQVAPEVFFLAGQDDVLRLVAQPVHDGRHHQAGQIVRHGPAQEEGDPLPPVHVPGHPVPLEEVGELVGDALGPAAPEGLIGQGDGQLLAVRIGHHAGELAGLGSLVRGLAARAPRAAGPRPARRRGGQGARRSSCRPSPSPRPQCTRGIISPSPGRAPPQCDIVRPCHRTRHGDEES